MVRVQWDTRLPVRTHGILEKLSSLANLPFLLLHAGWVHGHGATLVRYLKLRAWRDRLLVMGTKRPVNMEDPVWGPQASGDTVSKQEPRWYRE